MLFPSGRLFVVIVAAFIAAAGIVRAGGTVTVDLPIREKLVLPSGLSASPRQVTTPDGQGYAEFLLKPVREGEVLFVSVIFREDGEDGPAIFWTGDVSGEQVTLSANLAEGVAGWNRRTIRLTPEMTREAGRIYLSGDQRKILRVRLDWVEPVSVLIATDQEKPDLLAGGRLMFEREMADPELLAPPDAWFGDVLEAGLQEQVESLDGNVEFVVPLSAPANQSLLKAKFLGISPGSSVRVWVNKKLAGRLQPVMPPLTDPGYIRLRSGRVAYAGWREGTLLLPEGLLVAGDNSIVIEAPKKKAFIRDAALQLRVPVKPAEEPLEPERSEITFESSEMR